MNQAVSTDLVQFEHEVSPVVAEAQAIVVGSEVEKGMASEVLSKLNRYNDAVVEDREKITKPLNEALKEVRAKYKPLERSLEEAIDTVRNKIGVYQTEMLKRQRAEEARIAEKFVQGKIDLEKATSKMDAIEKVSDRVEGDSGAVSFRTDKVLKIVDMSLIPDEYWVVDEKELLRDLKNGNMVAGCELEEVQTVINRR